MPGETRWVLGVDSGGSGVRVAITRTDGTGGPGTVADDRPVATGEHGIDAAGLLERLLPRVDGLLHEVSAGSLAAACVGAAGMATLGDDLRAVLPAALEDAFGVRALALAGDAVTAYAGALGLRPGVVVAAGTGLIALGTAGDTWRRADGWGHLLGDAGGGAWIGRAGLEAAMRAHDGRAGGSAALLACAQELFGPAGDMPARLYPRTDRPAVLASFAPDVGRCAARDPVASEILRQAARHILESAAAVRPQPQGETRVGLAGGLFKMGEPLLGPLRDQAEWLLPDAVLAPAAGDPLDGALLIARALHSDALTLPCDGAMLHTVRR